MEMNGYRSCAMDHCYYIRQFGPSYIILLLYVDDMQIVESDIWEINRLKKQLPTEFHMKDLGVSRQILGMSIT